MPRWHGLGGIDREWSNETLWLNRHGQPAPRRLARVAAVVAVLLVTLTVQANVPVANQSTKDLATGGPVGTGLLSPDNLALDHDKNIYIVEDRTGGVDNDIWFARDLNDDGDLADAGEGIGRWASNGTPGSEFTGLYFDPTNKRRTWVNIQHPTSTNDRTIEITTR